MNRQKRDDKELRKSLLAQIHIGKKELGLDDETYRDVVENATGYRSAGTCSINQLYDILSVMNEKGANIKPARRYKNKHSLQDLKQYCGEQKPKNEQEGMIFKLWVDICKANKAHSPSSAGLRGLCNRITGKTAPRFCSAAELQKLIEALKNILRR